jgi:DNA-binding transcriptional LysR family regulator
MIEHRHLRYFIAVAEQRNFSRAAERLYMAQPPLSAAIRRLEQELGVELLRRTTREVTLTEAGAAFLEGAHRTVAVLQRSASDARRIAAGGLRQLRVGVGCPAHIETFSRVREEFRDVRHDVAVVDEHIWTSEVSEALRRGTLDVALASCPEFDPELSSRTIRRERVFALVSEDHASAQAAQVALPELAASEFLCPPADLTPRFHEVLVGMCQSAGFDPIISRHCLVSGWEVDIVLDKDSVTLAAESFAPVVPDGIVTLPLTPLTHLDTAVLWRTDDPTDDALAFAEVATSVFAQTLEPAAA